MKTIIKKKKSKLGHKADEADGSLHEEKQEKNLNKEFPNLEKILMERNHQKKKGSHEEFVNERQKLHNDVKIQEKQQFENVNIKCEDNSRKENKKKSEGKKQQPKEDKNLKEKSPEENENKINEEQQNSTIAQNSLLIPLIGNKSNKNTLKETKKYEDNNNKVNLENWVKKYHISDYYTIGCGTSSSIVH